MTRLLTKVRVHLVTVDVCWKNLFGNGVVRLQPKRIYFFRSSIVSLDEHRVKEVDSQSVHPPYPLSLSLIQLSDTPSPIPLV